LVGGAGFEPTTFTV